jgi:hypothetical protein
MAATESTIRFGKRDDDRLDVHLTLSGAPAAVIEVLVHGLPYESIREIHDALQRELEARATAKEPTP